MPALEFQTLRSEVAHLDQCWAEPRVRLWLGGGRQEAVEWVWYTNVKRV